MAPPNPGTGTGGPEDPNPIDPTLLFDPLITAISDTRDELSLRRGEATELTESLKNAERNLASAIELGEDTSALNSDISSLTASLASKNSEIETLRTDELNHLNSLHSSYTTHQLAVNQLSDGVPILFFPVRLETTFQNTNTST